MSDTLDQKGFKRDFEETQFDGSGRVGRRREKDETNSLVCITRPHRT